MKISTNYKLKLPEASDPVQVADLSGNFTEIDKIIGNLAAKAGSKLSFVSGSVQSASANVTISIGKTIKEIFVMATVTTGYGANNAVNGKTYQTEMAFSVGALGGTTAVSPTQSDGSAGQHYCSITPSAPNDATSCSVSLKVNHVSSGTLNFKSATVRYVAIVEE